MRLSVIVGSALLLAPSLAMANDNDTTSSTAPRQTQQQGTTATRDNAQQDLTTRRLLPKDAKLVGSVEATEVRAFPEQMGKSERASGVEKEGLAGASGLDRVWTTKQAYTQTVGQLDQKLKNEGIEPMAKTTTPSSTAWNVRMPDGHIANVIVRNTKPTTIESVQAVALTGTATETDDKTQQQNAPSSKSKTNLDDSGTRSNPNNLR